MQSGSERFRFMSIQNLMTRDVYCVKSTDRIMDVWLALMEKDISGAPVLDADGGIVGVISITDINKAIVERVGKARTLREATSPSLNKDDLAREEMKEMTLSIRAVSEGNVSSILSMRPEVMSIGPNDSLDRALKLIAEKNVNRLPVIKDGLVVGIVTRQDIILAFSGKRR